MTTASPSPRSRPITPGRRARWGAALVGLLAVLAPAGAHAAPGSPCSDGARDDAERAERLAFIEARVEHGARRSRAWALGWGVGLGTLAVGQLALLPVVPGEVRPDFYVGAAASAVGALTRAVFVPRVIGHRRRLRRSPGSADLCTRLAEQEHELREDAVWERKGGSWVMHGLNLGFNAGVGVVLGVLLRRPVPGNRLGAMGAVIGEVMIISQPRVMLEAQADYERRFAPAGLGWRAAPLVLPGGGGLAIGGRW